MIGSMRTTKRDWYARGGLSNSLCWRRQVGSTWQYYVRFN